MSFSRYHLVLVNGDGTHKHPLWSAPRTYAEVSGSGSGLSGLPAWNPTGSKLAVAVPDSRLPAPRSSSHGPGYVIWVIDAGTGTSRQLADERHHPLEAAYDSAVTWNPAGTMLAYVAADNALTLVGAGGGSTTPLSGPSSSKAFATLSWSPANAFILTITIAPPTNKSQFSGSGTLSLYPIHGGPARTITVSTSMPDAAYYSPDGRQIIVAVDNLQPAGTPSPPPFSGPRTGPTASLLVANADGSHAAALPNLASFSYRDTLTGWVLVPGLGVSR
ncbi:MAG: hypothetical protein M3Y91_07155 [Actinomycetota bacterium]|nr:hypothetical protein [Actinomycetota bacterium]